MTNKDLYFFRLDAHQAAVVIGMLEIVSALMVYICIGVSLGGAASYGVLPSQLGFDSQEMRNGDAVVYGVMGLILIVFVILMIVPVLLLIGAVKSNQCMLLPWIVVGWMRVISGIFLSFILFALPLGSCVQVFYFLGLALYFLVTVYTLRVVTSSYSSMRLTEVQNHIMADMEKMPYKKL